MVRLAKLLIIGVALLFLFERTGYGAEFADVKSTDWYLGELNALVRLGAISGVRSTSGEIFFQPNRLVTRAEFLKLCLQTLAKGPRPTEPAFFPAPDAPPFVDVPTSEWYAGYVAFAKQWDIADPTLSSFNPQSSVTRRDAVRFILKTLDLNGGARQLQDARFFPDAATDPYVYTAFRAKIVSGYLDGTFRPDRALSRAEAVVLVSHALDNLDQSPQVRFEMTAFTLDNPPLRQNTIECPCPGFGIRLNQPEDSRNLVQVRLHGNPPAGGGTYYALHRTSDAIKVWAFRNKLEPAFLDGNDTHRFEFGVAEDVFVENVTRGASVLSLELRRSFDDGVISRQTIGFETLDLLVIVIGGNNQRPELYDPGNPTACNPNICGIFTVGGTLYSDGYDAWLANQEDVNLDGRGKAYDFVRQAIEQRGVRRLALIGYSWGAGALYDLTAALEEDVGFGDFEIIYTAYVDAIKSESNFYEHRRPRGSKYHLNLHQNSWHCYIIFANLCGIATEAVDGAVTINIPVNDTEWGKDLTHFFIDDPPLVTEMIVGHFKKALR